MRLQLRGHGGYRRGDQHWPPQRSLACFATGNGVPPIGRYQPGQQPGASWARRDFLSVSDAGVADWNLSGALCLRNLVTGNDTAAQRCRPV